MQDLLDAPLVGSHEIQGPKAKDGGAAPGQFLEVDLFDLFPTTQDEFGNETRAIGKGILLSFQWYQVRLQRTTYAFWASVLMQAAPGIRSRVEVDLGWASFLN